MKKTVILIAAAIALLTGCATEQPPPADSPEPPAHSGKFVSEYGSMTFTLTAEISSSAWKPTPMRHLKKRAGMK
ncbi:MAG: hypothetical protein ACI4J1_04145 [Ruminiclostridium sp.]